MPTGESLSYVDALKGLSPREIEILDLTIEGLTNSEIARRLSLSRYTIETHKKNITSKAGVEGFECDIEVAYKEKLLIVLRIQNIW